MDRVYRIMIIAVIALPMFMAIGCTRNNGDIGDLFGRWRIESLTADGLEMPLYGDSSDGDNDVLLYTLSFQGSLVWIQTLYPHHDQLTVKGAWSRSGDRLMLDFSHNGSDGDVYYRPPKELCLVENGVTPLTVVFESSSDMVLAYIADNGVEYEYRIVKAY